MHPTAPPFANLFQGCDIFSDPLTDGVCRTSFLDHAYTFHRIDEVHGAYRDWQKAKQQPLQQPLPTEITAYVETNAERPRPGTDEWMDSMRKLYSKKALKMALTGEQRRALQSHDRILRANSTAAVEMMYEDFLRERSNPEFDVRACFRIFHEKLTSGLSEEPEVRNWLEGKLFQPTHGMQHGRRDQSRPSRNIAKVDSSPHAQASATSRQTPYHTEPQRPQPLPPPLTRMDPDLASQSQSAGRLPSAASEHDSRTWNPRHEGLQPHDEHPGLLNKPSFDLDIFAEIEEPPFREGFLYSDFTREVPPWTRFSPSK
ncbi:hypothetical protein HII31_02711 [Pseudocercospora fuligena]|uniref:Uncharacterized protein n=1 Tax=Pseudocercospora fuligena TaxID=685502 RepID=A0A8H6RRM5_9PEZI|nr:hypothetical protein HII31_02711 [Pseudocercospora fuligena]